LKVVYVATFSYAATATTTFGASVVDPTVQFCFLNNHSSVQDGYKTSFGLSIFHITSKIRTNISCEDIVLFTS
jgi:hypothetical protein